MMISTRGRYALLTMLDIAKHQGDGFVPLKDSASRQDISKKYLEQIVIIPGISELLLANRGKGGGYRLAKDPGEYTVGQILRAAEGSLVPVACLGEEHLNCAHTSNCSLLPVWKGLDKVITGYLDSITLKDVIDQSEGIDGSDNYII